MKTRIYWIDSAKALCIFLVVLGHAHIPLSFKSDIYVFHIPLFFFISGLFFSFEKYPDYKSFLKKRIFQLVIPYFFFNIFTYIFWVFIGRKVGDDAHLLISPFKPLVGIFFGTDADHYLEHCAPLWFLACLFTVENLYYLVFRKFKKNISIVLGFIAFAIIGFLDYKFNPIRFGWGLNVAFVMVVFYGIGSLLNSNLFNLNKIKTVSWFYVLIFSILIVLTIAKINGKIEVSVDYFGNYFYFFVGALAGITLVISVAFFIERIFGHILLLQYIGRNTLIILGLHIFAGSIAKGITYFIFNLPLSIFEIEWVAIIYSVFCIIILIPAMMFMNKYMSFVIGKNKL